MPLNINADAQTVKLHGFGYLTDWSNRTWNLASGITAADIGKAVALDAASRTVKLAANNDRVLGRLETFEDRVNEGTKVGTVKMVMAGVKLPVLAEDTLAAGDTCVGGGSGTVKKETNQGHKNLLAVEVSGGFAVVYNI